LQQYLNRVRADTSIARLDEVLSQESRVTEVIVLEVVVELSCSIEQGQIVLVELLTALILTLSHQQKVYVVVVVVVDGLHLLVYRGEETESTIGLLILAKEGVCETWGSNLIDHCVDVSQGLDH
jgi:hypothetical protein